ncbi:DUF2520 domain-containing protein [Candidatus Ozemobacteraceae bacterium]|nr:DUF2520 domain-containing protein [Candidatus Ozemobacteraceae bacterium]
MSTSVGILGTGRLAAALVPYLLGKGISVSGIWGRKTAEAQRIGDRHAISTSSGPGDLAGRSKIIILAINDDSLTLVAELLAEFPLSGRVVVHASGCRGLDVLEPVERAGGIAACVHPLMTLVSEGGGPNPLEGAPCGVACRDRRWRRLLSTWLARAGNTPFPLADGDRPLYHAAAVLACAGLSQLVATASGIMADGLGVPASEARRLLMPLARRTLDLAGRPDPVPCTGPWTRGDAQTAGMHLAALRRRPGRAAALYEALMDLAKENT